jgi:DNA-binding CsgD family transcriptional regulator
VTHKPEIVTKRGVGGQRYERTEKEIERMDILLEVKTYDDAARRLGISEAAMKQTMARIMLRYSSAKAFANTIEKWNIKRRNFKRGNPVAR